MKKLFTNAGLESEKTWAKDLCLLTALELPWGLPFQTRPSPKTRSKQKLCFYSCLGELVHRAEFGVITPADGTTVKLNDDRRIVDIEFASGAVEIPLFRENGSLRADVPISHDASAWRLRQAGMTGFPRHGCFSYDFLESGIFVSPSQRVVGQRFVVHNAGTKAVTILAESDQDWLTLEPSKFRLRAGSNDSIRLLLLLEKLAEGEHHATVQLRYQRETIKARIHVSISPGPPRPALQRPDVELAIAGMQDSVSIALEFVGQNQQIVEGSVWDPLHRLRKTFRSVVQNGRARATVTLPTSELIKSIYATWPLRVFVHSTKEIFEQVLLVRLVRQLFFEPSMPVLAPGKDVSVRVLRHDGAQIQLLVEDSPSELKTRVEGVCLVIQAQKQLAGRGALQWIRLRDEISGERAMLPARL